MPIDVIAAVAFEANAPLPRWFADTNASVSSWRAVPAFAPCSPAITALRLGELALEAGIPM